jgi:hypothetical protein
MMTKKTFGVMMSSVFLLVCVSAMQLLHAQDKPSSLGTLQVKLNYTGSGRVNDKHKILVFLFDSSAFVRGGAAPFAAIGATSKDGAVTFHDVAKSPVYVGTVYDPSGQYDGQTGPPPSGSSMGIYKKTQGEPAPVAMEAGKTISIEVPFDDTVKMP